MSTPAERAIILERLSAAGVVINTEPMAWMTPDGQRVIPAHTKVGAAADGGAMQSSTAVYAVPLYTHPTLAARVMLTTEDVLCLRRTALDLKSDGWPGAAMRVDDIADRLTVALALVPERAIAVVEAARGVEGT